jgi:2-amino-4-hydroxy-6-hydroxymethyldihydropteridine diphosphokinase
MLNHFITDAYIGLGSNLDDPYSHLAHAVHELGELPFSSLHAVSSFYKSKPMGPAGQPPYANAVACLKTRLVAVDLLHELQAIENKHGRERKQHWGPRTLDLDILVYGNAQMNCEELTIPHPGIKYREFVIYPLHEINKDLMIPGLGTVHRIEKNCYANGLIQLHG